MARRKRTDGTGTDNPGISRSFGLRVFSQTNEKAGEIVFASPENLPIVLFIMKYPTVFHLISTLSRDRDAPCVLIGGFAVNYYKVTRQTADLDFLIMAKDFKKIVKLLEEEGYEENYSQEVFSRLTTDSDYLLDLDFMFVDGETLSKIINKGRVIEIAEQKFIVPSLDHLIALKLHSIKHNPGLRKEKDLSDIIELIKANEVDIGSNDFKDICLKYGTRELYEEILTKI